MRLSEDVIRHMTLRVDELDEGPSAMMKNRSERSRSYGDRGDSSGSSEGSRESSSGPKRTQEASDAPAQAAGDSQ